MKYLLNCLIRYEEDGAILISGGNITSVNKIGTLILSLIDMKVNDDESIAKYLCKIFDNVKYIDMFSDVQEFIAEMIEKGYVKGETSGQKLSETEDEDRIMTRLNEILGQASEKKYLDLKTPLMVHIDLTDKCNQKCVFCYNSISEASDSKVKKEDWAKVIDKLNECKVGKFNFLGGEPLIVFDEMIYLCERANKFSFLSFSTNGSYSGGITEEQCRQLERFKDRFSVRVSINAMHEDHDKIVRSTNAFKNAVNTIKNLISFDIPVSVSITVNKIVLGQWREMIEYFQQFAVTDIEFRDWQYFGDGSVESEFRTTPHEYKKLVENIDKYVMEKEVLVPVLVNNRYTISAREHEPMDLFNKRVLCGIYKSMHIKSNGDVFICHGGFEDELKLGNVFVDEIVDIWSNKLRKQLISTSREDIKNEECRKCEQLDVCLGGCKVASYKFHGNYYEGDPMCPHVCSTLCTC